MMSRSASSAASSTVWPERAGTASSDLGGLRARNGEASTDPPAAAALRRRRRRGHGSARQTGWTLLRLGQSGDAPTPRMQLHLPIPDLPRPAEHPVVRTHPETGRRSLYINPWFTERFTDMTPAESRPLIEYLSAEATRPENVYRHRWRRHDVLMWDNRVAMHYAVRDYDENAVRIMHRTTAAGDRPV